jgi:hypothetical protein
MREQEVRELYEAYLQVHQVQEEEVEELNEGRTTSLSALSRESQKRKDDKKRGRPETESEIHSRLMMGKFRPGASQEERAEGGRQVLKDRGKVPKKGGKDMFEHILEHLVAEGYADTNEAALKIMGNMSEEWRRSIVEGFPNVQNKPRPGDAGTSGLKMIQTPGGQRGYINKHSGGEILPSGTVDKIMGGNLMVKNGTKKNTNSNIA